MLLQFEQSPGRLLRMPPTYGSRQCFASPAQPFFAGKYGVVRPCLSALFSLLPWLCFDKCVRGWRSRRCQLSPCQERGAGGRPGGSAQPPVLPRLQGQRACWVGMMRRPRAFRAAQGHAPGLWPQGSPLLSYKKAQELLQSFANPMGIITPQQ